jgi:PAS domain S-box-containing protein
VKTFTHSLLPADAVDHQLKLAARRLAAFVESSDDAFIGKDPDGIITDWNQGAERLFGYTAMEIVGTPIARLIPADRQSEEVLILERIRRGEKVERLETLRLAKDGRAIKFTVTIPLRKPAAA